MASTLEVHFPEAFEGSGEQTNSKTMGKRPGEAADLPQRSGENGGGEEVHR